MANKNLILKTYVHNRKKVACFSQPFICLEILLSEADSHWSFSGTNPTYFL